MANKWFVEGFFQEGHWARCRPGSQETQVQLQKPGFWGQSSACGRVCPLQVRGVQTMASACVVSKAPSVGEEASCGKTASELKVAHCVGVIQLETYILSICASLSNFAKCVSIFRDSPDKTAARKVNYFLVSEYWRLNCTFCRMSRLSALGMNDVVFLGWVKNKKSEMYTRLRLSFIRQHAEWQNNVVLILEWT